MLFIFSPPWIFVSLSVWFIAIIAIGLCMVKAPIYRTSVAYSALIAAISGCLYNFIGILAIYTSHSSFFATFFFYAVYTAFAFVPGLIAFKRISKQSCNHLGTYIAYFGYIWAFTMIVSGLVYSIIKFRALENQDFLSAGYCGFVVLDGLLHVLNRGRLEKSAQKTLILYSVLNLISVIAFFINWFIVYISSESFAPVALFFVEIPMVSAIIVAASKGHLWTFQYIDDIVESNRPRSIKSFV